MHLIVRKHPLKYLSFARDGSAIALTEAISKPSFINRFALEDLEASPIRSIVGHQNLASVLGTASPLLPVDLHISCILHLLRFFDFVSFVEEIWPLRFWIKIKVQWSQELVNLSDLLVSHLRHHIVVIGSAEGLVELIQVAEDAVPELCREEVLESVEIFRLAVDNHSVLRQVYAELIHLFLQTSDFLMH